MPPRTIYTLATVDRFTGLATVDVHSQVPKFLLHTGVNLSHNLTEPWSLLWDSVPTAHQQRVPEPVIDALMWRSFELTYPISYKKKLLF